MNVNLGSGLLVAEGWVNIDSSLNALTARWPKALMVIPYRLSNVRRWYSFGDYVRLLKKNVFVHHDLVYGIPLPDASADGIYAGHVIEHLYRNDAEHLLREAHRVLKPGGVIRLDAPDFERFVDAYRDENREAVLDALFGESAELGWYSRHRYIYDFDLLSKILREIGFTDVTRCEDATGSLPDLDTFEGNRPTRYLLILEARKPGPG